MLTANFTLGYILWNPDPVLIDFGFYALRWYSVLFATGIALSYILMRQAFRRAGLAGALFEKFVLAIGLGMFVGMRLGHFLFYEPMAFINRPVEVFLPVSFTPELHFTGYQGLASHGGAIGVLIAVGWFIRKHRAVSAVFVLSQLAWVSCLLGGFIRLGNLMNSEIIGHPTTVPWAFVFASVDQLPRHPAQLYEALGYFAIFVLLLSWQRQPKFQQQGRLFGVLLVLIFGWRFLIEFFKEDQEAFEQTMWLNMGQLLSLPFVIGGMLIWYRSRRRETYNHR
jgi:prolipoprotein diacylglyceryl transferase